MITQFLVIVHMPHKDIVCPFSTKRKALSYFEQLLEQCKMIYGATDMNGATIDHCYEFGIYNIGFGYFVQLYEADLDEKETIPWTPKESIIRPKDK